MEKPGLTEQQMREAEEYAEARRRIEERESALRELKIQQELARMRAPKPAPHAKPSRNQAKAQRKARRKQREK